jgi:hypothetical protein
MNLACGLIARMPPSIPPRDEGRARQARFRTAPPSRDNRSNRGRRCRARRGYSPPRDRDLRAAEAAAAFSRSRAPRPAKPPAKWKRQRCRALSFFLSTCPLSHGCPETVRATPRTVGPVRNINPDPGWERRSLGPKPSKSSEAGPTAIEHFDAVPRPGLHLGAHKDHKGHQGVMRRTRNGISAIR